MLPTIGSGYRADFLRAAKYVRHESTLTRGYLIDMMPEEDRADVLRRERSLLYVAATRARDELVVVYVGEPSKLLPAVAISPVPGASLANQALASDDR
jgi:superfamily I DNA/RNA helicase